MTGACAVMASACAVHSPFAIESSDGKPTGLTAVAIEQSEATGAQQSDFRKAIQTAFTAHSVVVQAEAPHIALVGISLNDANSGIAAGVDPDTKDVDWNAHPHDNHWLDKCRPQRLRGTLVLLARTSSEMVYRGVAQGQACQFGDEDIARLADTLVQDALRSAAGQ